MKPVFKIILVVLAILLLYTYTGKQLLSAQQARSKIASGQITTVVDVRTYAEYAAGHYPGAIHIPVNEISRETTASLPPRGLLVYCNTGQRARFAAKQLTSLGFRDVYYIACTYKCLS